MSSTQRFISTSFWTDAWVQSLDPSEKLLYLHYMTNPQTNIAGVYKITERSVSFDTGFSIDTIRNMMVKFEAAGKAFRLGEYIALPSWPKHQRWEKSVQIKTGIIRCLAELPPEILKKLVGIGYKFDLVPIFNTLGIPYPYPPSYLDSELDMEKDSDMDPDAKPNTPGNSIPESPTKAPEPDSNPEESKPQPPFMKSLMELAKQKQFQEPQTGPVPRSAPIAGVNTS